ncbi:putative tubulin polyglutamylase ttll2 [Thoreauomyces humboldtii]|nr:putative tubulin polyglutamylase ttll2 [Thoreauomyces humboldtii]
MATTASREGDVPPLASHSAEDQTVPRKYYILADTGPSAVRDVLEAEGIRTHSSHPGPFPRFHPPGHNLISIFWLHEGWLPYIPSQSPYWNLWWKGSRFLKSDYADLTSYQRLNHFPRTTALTRKDSLYRLLRTMRGIYGVSHFDFVPETWSLPNDYTKFVKVYADEEFDGRGRRRGMWICKPADQSRGRGVFVFRELGALMYEGNAVLQRYIGNPLLISGYKFDMRCYVVVRSYSPLVIYNYHEGLARFATHPYTPTDDSNIYAHLTNTSINKFSPWLSHEKEEVGAGCRWTFGRLRKWFEACGIDGERVWRRIHGTIVSTLLPIAAEVPSVPDGCFELYGFDILLDDALKPWLLEVNFGPALSLDTDVDVEVKKVESSYFLF